MPELMLHIDSGINAKAIHSHLFDPIAIRLAQFIAHDWVSGVQIIQAGKLIVQALVGVIVVGDVWGEVINACLKVGGVARIVLVKRGDRQGGGVVGVDAVALCGVVLVPVMDFFFHIPIGEIVTHMVCHDVLNQVHLATVQRAR